MELFEKVGDTAEKLLPALIAIVAVLAILWAINWFLLHRKRGIGEESRFPKRIAVLLCALAGVVVIILSLPVEDATRDQLFTLLGLLLTAIIALSSTTVVANILAGMMLRTVRSFRPGDFIRVGEQFGRVTERGIFHVEIQTEDRDLTTIPNVFMISHPITVVSSSGTIVSARVSLGFENAHPRVDALLAAAAEAADLQEPFVQVSRLGDFSVTYRVAGFLPEAKHLLTARSNLRKAMLDSLHGAGIEIVSPSFMNQRPQPEGSRAVPAERVAPAKDKTKDETQVHENLVFDKAEAAEKAEQFREERDSIAGEIKELEGRLKEAGEEERPALETQIEQLRRKAEAIDGVLEQEEKKEDK